MDTKQVTHEIRLRQWAKIMRERQASGMSINAWCEVQGIRRQQYFYWQRKLREAACKELAGKPVKGLIPADYGQAAGGFAGRNRGARAVGSGADLSRMRQ